MKRHIWLSFGIAFVMLAVGSASGEERFVPSTVSKEAAQVIRELEPDSLPAGTREEWQAAWEATEEASQPLNDQARNVNFA